MNRHEAQQSEVDDDNDDDVGIDNILVWITTWSLWSKRPGGSGSK